MHPAGIFRDIAADRTGNLARRIGRVIKALVGNGLGDGEIGHARLHHCATVIVIHVEDAVEARHAQHDAISQRQRPARKRRARSARHHLHAICMAPGQDLAYLFGRARQHNGQRALPVHHQPIAAIGRDPIRIGDHPVRHDGGKRGGNLGLSGHDSCVGFGHLHAFILRRSPPALLGPNTRPCTALRRRLQPVHQVG